MSTQHELKIWPQYFEAVMNGTKTWELRKADREFKVGDTLLLREYVSDGNRYTGRECTVHVIGITITSHMDMVDSGYVILSLGGQADVSINCLADWAKAGPAQINRGNWGLVLAGLLKARQELENAGRKETWLQGYIAIARSGAELPEGPQ